MSALKWLRHVGAFVSLAGLVLLVLSGCSSGAPGGGIVSGGNLQITVSGLPQGTDANVLVNGPDGYQQRATASTTLTKLVPGSYTVTPLAVMVSKMGYQASKAQTVNISALSGAAVKMTYSELPRKVPATTVALDAQTAQSLSSVTNGTLGNATLTFSQSTAQLRSLKIGDVVMVGVTTATPKGFMGKVTSIAGLTVTTAPAKLTEAIQQGVIALSQILSPSDIQSVKALQPGTQVKLVQPSAQQLQRLSPQGSVTLNPICANLTTSLSASGDVVGTAVTVAGSVCLTPRIDFDASIGAFTVNSADFIVSGSVASQITVTGQLSASVSKKIPIFDIVLEPINLWDVPPIILTPTITVYVEGSGQITLGVSTGVSDNFTFSAGASYDGDNWSPVSAFHNSFQYNWPQPGAGATIKLSAGPGLSFDIDGLAGPVVGMDGYLALDVNFLQDPLWTLHTGLEVNVGVSALLGLVSYTATVFQKDWVLATSNSTPPKGAALWSYATGDVIAMPALGPDGAVYVGDGTGNLYALSNKRNDANRLKWTYRAGAAIYAAPSIASDGTLYLSTGDGLFAIAPSGSLEWQALQGIWVDASASIAADGTVYAATQDGNIYALNPGSGSVKWSFKTGGSIITSSPAIGTDGVLYVGSSDGHLYALNPDGSLKWDRVLGIYVSTSPAIDGSTVYALATEDGAYQFLIAFNASNGKLLWQVTVNDADLDTSPTIGADGTVYVGSVDHKLYAIDGNGHVKWSYQANGLIKGAPTVGADGDIYITATGASTSLYAVKADGSLDWQAPLKGEEAFGVALGGSGDVYVSTGGAAGQTQGIYGGSQGLAASPWPKLHHDNQNTGRAH
jgi:outer membrane protein assembly factor BamB